MKRFTDAGRGAAAGFAALLAFAWAAPSAAGEHVRVVLDVSKSMRATDPGGLARLSTVLLYDLARPQTTLDDSFEVLPFHPTGHWSDPADPPPTSVGRRVLPTDGRAAFARAVSGLGYEADWTYFYPGLAAAIHDLERTPRRSDVRVVVVITDGLPEAPTREEEARRLREELLPRLEGAGIMLYVLAFGPEASAHRQFFDDLVRAPGGGQLGAVFVDPTGDGLLGSMLELFGYAFGYTQDPPQPVSPELTIDLDGGTTPAQAVAVLYSRRSTPPSFDLREPASAPRPPPAPDGVEVASDLGASYALQWVLSPFAGDHTLRTDAAVGSVAVLRPTRLRLAVAAPPGRQAVRTMAGTSLPLDVLVSPEGPPGDPGEVELSFRPHGPRDGTDPATGEAVYAWEGSPGAPPADPSRQVVGGRLYGIEAVFEREPAPGEPFYAGYLEIEARRGGARVGEMAGDR
ncbi:MAG: hypothetical protein AAFY88_01180, partial [Acidobacteriota bacterium]